MAEGQVVASVSFDEDGTMDMILVTDAIRLTRADVRKLINQLEREGDGDVYSRA